MSESALAAAATACVGDFSRLVSDVPYERKGILYSEMFFLFLCAQQVAPRRILESGRARGQSTELLARMFPDLQVVSIEYDADSPDVPIAARRLAAYANVDLRFGDATRLLPAEVAPGDIVLIDGPKGFRGLRLALSLLATGKPALVFLHDAGIGTVERKFLERHLPGLLASDHPPFVAIARVLDAAAADTIPPENRATSRDHGYGYGLVCLPYARHVAYRILLVRAAARGFINRIFRRQG